MRALAHSGAIAASLMTAVWRLRTDTKRYHPEWWGFLAAHAFNVVINALALGAEVLG